jgi:hypothetical protein
VAAGDWFVGKAAASVVILHPELGKAQIFTTHVLPLFFLSRHRAQFNSSFMPKVAKMGPNTEGLTGLSMLGNSPSWQNTPQSWATM